MLKEFIVRKIKEGMFLKDKNMLDISKELGLSYPTVHKICKTGNGHINNIEKVLKVLEIKLK